MYRLAAKRAEKSRRKRDRQSGVHWSCYILLFTDFVNYDQSHSLEWIVLECWLFINSTRWIGSCVYQPFKL